MKKFLLSLLFCAFLGTAFSQTCESFTGLSKPPDDWFIGGGAQIRSYNDPSNNCTLDEGLQTPGIGGSNPTRIVQNARTYSTATPIVSTSFEIYVFDANTNCAGAKNFPCPTLVKVYLVKSTYTSTNGVPAASDIYAETEYTLVNPGNNTIVFNALTIPNGASYRILLDFKSADLACNQGNTKYILDDVCSTVTNCPDGPCPPYANNDYFEQGISFAGNILKANVYGGFALWATASPAEFATRSLSESPAVNNGVDGDNNNHLLSTMKFNLISGPTVVVSTNCPGGVAPVGTLIFNLNGTFTYTRANNCVERVRFTYQIEDPGGLLSNIATVIIDFAPNTALPVNLKSFNVNRATSSNVNLTWTTASEQNSKGFNVQKNVGGEWKTTGFVPSQATGGNSSIDLSYNFKDVNNEKGITQYRIQQVDLDGKFAYTDIRAIRGENTVGKVVVYPNPSVDGKLNVVFEDNSSLRDVHVSDMQGKIIRSYRNISNNILVIEKLTSGFYTIKVTNRNTAASSVEKVVVK